MPIDLLNTDRIFESFSRPVPRRRGMSITRGALTSQEIDQLDIEVLQALDRSNKSALFAIVEGTCSWEDKSRMFNHVVDRVITEVGEEAAEHLLLAQSNFGNTILHKLIKAHREFHSDYLSNEENVSDMLAIISRCVGIAPGLFTRVNGRGEQIGTSDIAQVLDNRPVTLAGSRNLTAPRATTAASVVGTSAFAGHRLGVTLAGSRNLTAPRETAADIVKPSAQDDLLTAQVKNFLKTVFLGNSNDKHKSEIIDVIRSIQKEKSLPEVTYPSHTDESEKLRELMRTFISFFQDAYPVDPRERHTSFVQDVQKYVDNLSTDNLFRKYSLLTVFDPKKEGAHVAIIESMISHLFDSPANIVNDLATIRSVFTTGSSGEYLGAYEGVYKVFNDPREIRGIDNMGYITVGNAREYIINYTDQQIRKAFNSEVPREWDRDSLLNGAANRPDHRDRLIPKERTIDEIVQTAEEVHQPYPDYITRMLLIPNTKQLIEERLLTRGQMIELGEVRSEILISKSGAALLRGESPRLTVDQALQLNGEQLCGMKFHRELSFDVVSQLDNKQQIEGAAMGLTIEQVRHSNFTSAAFERISEAKKQEGEQFSLIAAYERYVVAPQQHIVAGTAAVAERVNDAPAVSPQQANSRG